MSPTLEILLLGLHSALPLVSSMTLGTSLKSSSCLHLSICKICRGVSFQTVVKIKCYHAYKLQVSASKKNKVNTGNDSIEILSSQTLLNGVEAINGRKEGGGHL